MSARTRLLIIALVCAFAGVAPVVAGGGDEQPVGRAEQVSAAARTADRSTPPGQTSEGIEGEHVAPTPSGRPLPARVSKAVGWRVAPGIHYKRWDRTDRRGKIRAHLITVNYRKRGVSFDYASERFVPGRDPLGRLLSRDRAVAGVNGGFFDIHDTGAPLGVGVDRQRGFLHATRYAWYNAFFVTRSGTPRIGALPLTATIAQYPELDITNVNAPRVRAGGIGVYNPDWGVTSGYRITDGQTSGVRMVVIRGGQVIANTTSLNANERIDATVLIGRGPGATRLEQLRVGSTATVRWGVAGSPAFAIGGEKVLLHDRRIRVTDDSELHPRTAVGIDRDQRRVLLLAIDGRSSRSRGYTMVELARMMRGLGAEDALNLDGGGSTTMVADNRNGKLSILNSPSDGAQRSIADAIGVHYRRP